METCRRWPPYRRRLESARRVQRSRLHRVPPAPFPAPAFLGRFRRRGDRGVGQQTELPQATTTSLLKPWLRRRRSHERPSLRSARAFAVARKPNLSLFPPRRRRRCEEAARRRHRRHRPSGPSAFLPATAVMALIRMSPTAGGPHFSPTWRRLKRWPRLQGAKAASWRRRRRQRRRRGGRSTTRRLWQPLLRGRHR
ncbi:unnamed protein product [Ectocarpus sp. 13 AM-2016]